MPFFPGKEEIFDLIASELPADMFSQDRADDPSPAKRSVSSSEIRAYATLIEDIYNGLKNIYLDKHLTTVTDAAVPRWEKMLFADSQDQSQPIAVRVSNLLTKMRASGGISFKVMNDILSGLFVDTGITFEIVTYCGVNGGAWRLDVSLLDVDTYLSKIDPINYAGLDCADLGSIDPTTLADIQEVAYTYEVRIFGHASDALVARIDSVCTDFEPARSTHKILNDFPGPLAP